MCARRRAITAASEWARPSTVKSPRLKQAILQSASDRAQAEAGQPTAASERAGYLRLPDCGLWTRATSGYPTAASERAIPRATRLRPLNARYLGLPDCGLWTRATSGYPTAASERALPQATRLRPHNTRYLGLPDCGLWTRASRWLTASCDRALAERPRRLLNGPLKKGNRIHCCLISV